jgi:endonuclease YncB( thermonuclease family)
MKFFRHCLGIIATLPFAGWHWLQPRSRAHGYTRPAIDQGQAIEGRCVEVTDGDTIKVLSAGNELIRVPLAFIDTPEKAQAFKKRL